MVPIWKDYTVRVAQSACYFRIRLDGTSGTIVYEGKSVAKPGDNFVDIRINDICANYLKHYDLVFGQSVNASRVSRTFVLQWAETPSGTWTTAATVEFQDDWSYDYDYDQSRDGLSFPITLRAVPGQLLLLNRLSGYYVGAVLRFEDGTQLTANVPVRRTADFNNDYNDDYAKTSDSSPGVAMFDTAGYPGLTGVTMAGLTWTLAPHDCRRYALYYINAYGGWDTLGCRANGVEADSWERKTYGTSYDNAVRQARGTVDYLNVQSKRWTLRTGWLDDLGGSRMHHLLGSTMVYLHDIQEGIILPVVIATDSAQYKTYRSEGGKLIDYEFEVAIQQERVRR